MKRKLRRIIKIAVPILIAISIPILLARCTPQWLPSSNGFVYFVGSSVKLFDLESGESKEIVRLDSPAAGVAVGPKGDRVAVVHWREKELTFAVYDMQGGQMHVSPVHRIKEVGGKQGYASLFTLNIYVSPDGKKIIAFLPGEKSGAIVYDVEHKTFREIPNVMSLGFAAGLLAAGEGSRSYLAMDASAITPDGMGFVALHTPEGKANDLDFVYFAWDAEEPVKLEMPADEKKLIQTAAKGKEFGVATAPRWDGGTLLMHIDDVTLNVNHGMRAASFTKSMRAEALLQHAEKHKVRVIAELEDGALVQMTKTELQLARPGAAPVELTKLADGGFVAVVPSPDGRRLLVRTMKSADAAAYYRVVDAKGKTLADFE